MFRAFLISVILVSGFFSSATFATTITWTQNNHEYQLVQFRGTWQQANDQLSDGWHLATITSQDEQDFISSSFANYRGEFWLGGYQGPQS